MRRGTVVAGAALAAAVVLAVAPTAGAHDGGIWFSGAQRIQDNAVDKWQLAKVACVGDRRGNTSEDGFKTTYDHFVCVVDSEVTDRMCFARIHIAGKQWHQIVLTSFNWRKEGFNRPPQELGAVRGCSPADIRTRPGYLNY